jgi:hypothetical protein
MPVGKRTVADCLDPGVAARVVAEQDIVSPVTEEVADPNDRIMRVGAANLMPAGKRTVADCLIQVSPVELLRNRISSVPAP